MSVTGPPHLTKFYRAKMDSVQRRQTRRDDAMGGETKRVTTENDRGFRTRSGFHSERWGLNLDKGADEMRDLKDMYAEKTKKHELEDIALEKRDLEKRETEEAQNSDWRERKGRIVDVVA